MISDNAITVDSIIIGAGLSGLTAAYYAEQKYGVQPLIVEARHETGGRIKTEDAVDLGATWLGERHEHLLELLDDLNLEIFPQYQKGKSVFVYSSAEAPHYFDMEQEGNPTFRISGGSSRLIETLASQTEAEIQSGIRVDKIIEKQNHLEIISRENIFKAQKVIITLPPQLAAATIKFTPVLPAKLLDTMKSTHTWMSNAIKVGLTYKTPFWRDKNLSGTLIAPNGPVIELYDHSDSQGKKFSLMGFANEALREYESDERKEKIISFLTDYFGEQVREYLAYKEKDWLEDDLTATPLSKSISMHPTYGNDAWEKSYMHGRLLFAGSETSASFGGYMEGAVAAGKKAATFLESM